MRLIILNDNVLVEGLLNDWGWSVFVEGRNCFIFDVDMNFFVLVYNLKVFGVFFNDFDFVFLSYWYYDYYGGFFYVGELNFGFRFYVLFGNRVMVFRWGFDVMEVFIVGEIVKGIWILGFLDDFE